MGFTAKYQQIIGERRDSLRRQLDSLLPGDTPFVWEIGCGHGHFFAAYAAAHPDRVCIGIDLAGERIERATRKRDRARLSNLHFLQADARLFLEMLPAAARMSAAFLLFPDPWPKLRHNKHRLLQSAFLSALAAHAAPDCPLYFRTDFTPYFEAGRQAIAHHRNWRIVNEPWPFEVATVFQQRAAAYHSLIARCAPDAQPI